MTKGIKKEYPEAPYQLDNSFERFVVEQMDIKMKMNQVKAITKEPIANISGKTMEAGEECTIISVWLNSLEQDIYCKVINKHGDFIITSLRKLKYKLI